MENLTFSSPRLIELTWLIFALLSSIVSQNHQADNNYSVEYHLHNLTIEEALVLMTTTLLGSHTRGSATGRTLVQVATPSHQFWSKTVRGLHSPLVHRTPRASVGDPNWDSFSRSM
jgi:hypothetical protein